MCLGFDCLVVFLWICRFGVIDCFDGGVLPYLAFGGVGG